MNILNQSFIIFAIGSSLALSACNDDNGFRTQRVAKHTTRKADKPKPKADKPKADKPKVDKPKVDKPKVDKPKVEKPEVDESKVDESKVDESKTCVAANSATETEPFDEVQISFSNLVVGKTQEHDKILDLEAKISLKSANSETLIKIINLGEVNLEDENPQLALNEHTIYIDKVNELDVKLKKHFNLDNTVSSVSDIDLKISIIEKDSPEENAPIGSPLEDLLGQVLVKDIESLQADEVTYEISKKAEGEVAKIDAIDFTDTDGEFSMYVHVALKKRQLVKTGLLAEKKVLLCVGYKNDSIELNSWSLILDATHNSLLNFNKKIVDMDSFKKTSAEAYSIQEHSVAKTCQENIKVENIHSSDDKLDITLTAEDCSNFVQPEDGIVAIIKDSKGIERKACCSKSLLK